jgi:high-affinity nickel-transport protein
MNYAANDWLALLALALVLGLRHGLDADHLAAIDGLARYQTSAPSGRASLARWSGLLFSVGHGLVVMLVAGLVGALPGQWQVPSWVHGLGVLISVGMLSVLGIANLHAVWTTPGHQHVRLLGLRRGWFGRVQQSGHPGAAVLLGGLFALSFDTLSLASLFALTAVKFGGVFHALSLGGTFMLGMVVVDALNGLWIARLLVRADSAALVASRVMGGVVATIALLVAGYGAAKYLIPSVASWSEGRELALGAGVIALLGCSFLAATRVVRPGPALPRAERP